MATRKRRHAECDLGKIINPVFVRKETTTNENLLKFGSEIVDTCNTAAVVTFGPQLCWRRILSMTRLGLGYAFDRPEA
jgi:hypothetical protein